MLKFECLAALHQSQMNRLNSKRVSVTQSYLMYGLWNVRFSFGLAGYGSHQMCAEHINTSMAADVNQHTFPAFFAGLPANVDAEWNFI